MLQVRRRRTCTQPPKKGGQLSCQAFKNCWRCRCWRTNLPPHQCCKVLCDSCSLTHTMCCRHVRDAACVLRASAVMCMRSQHPLSRSSWRRCCKHMPMLRHQAAAQRFHTASQPCQMACQKKLVMPQPPSPAPCAWACCRASTARAARGRRLQSSPKPCAARMATAQTGRRWAAALLQPSQQLSGVPMLSTPAAEQAFAAYNTVSVSG